MTARLANLFLPKNAETAQTVQYTATNCQAVIDKFTATNETAANIVFSINIVPSAGTASTANRVLSLRSIAPNETYLCPEVIGHLVPNAGTISTLASATGLTIVATGREIT